MLSGYSRGTHGVLTGYRSATLEKPPPESTWGTLGYSGVVWGTHRVLTGYRSATLEKPPPESSHAVSFEPDGLVPPTAVTWYSSMGYSTGTQW